jgi:AhpD family alkylhydroperoxidase
MEVPPSRRERHICVSPPAPAHTHRAYAATVARLDVPEGPGGDAAMVWTLRPELAGMVERMIRGAYQQSALPAAEREVARMRIAQLNDCSACSTFRAPSVREAGVAPDAYEHLHEYATYAGYTERQRLAIEYAERFATAHEGIDDAFFGRLRDAYTDAEVLDLTLCIAVYLGLGRTLAVLGVDEYCELDV